MTLHYDQHQQRQLQLIGLGFTLVLAVMLIITTLASMTLYRLRQDNDGKLHHHYEYVLSLKAMRNIMHERLVLMQTMTLGHGPAEIQQLYDRYQNLAEQFLALRSKLEIHIHDSVGAVEMKRLRMLTTRATMLNDRVIEQARSGRRRAHYSAQLNSALMAQQAIQLQINSVIDRHRTMHNLLIQKSGDESKRTIIITLGLIVLALALSGLIAALTLRAVRRQQLALITANNEASILRQEIYRDPLTHIANRSGLIEWFRAISADKAGDRCVGLLLLDLDGFKQINDHHGHDIGDLVLVEVAARLQDEVRDETDLVARLAGDEFIIALGDCRSDDEITSLSRRVLNVLSSTIHINSLNIDISASIGIARYPDDAITLADLLKSADTAMYHAKAAGKHTFCFHHNTTATSRALQS